ncbi:DUF3160 domain-containing protein [candidate division KSB1 bacterium]|nr:DUF3160 domain-containing protein [candidate division KSB1 bacterium]
MKTKIKLWWLGLLTIGFKVMSGYTQSPMIADITQPVTTEFGVYQPYLVDVTPNLAPDRVAPDFSNVINFKDFAFTPAELVLLAQNHFVVSPRREDGATGYREIYDIYNECRELDLPIFVTTDAMLHTFHLCFDKILKICETRQFFGDLNQLLTEFLNKTGQQIQSATNPQVDAALLTNLNFLIVAKKLLDSTYVEPINGGPYLQELQYIQAHQQGYTNSPIFGYEEDYSQYIVRGHYTQSDSLRHFFQSMMWLGRMTFDRKDTAFTRSALLLVQALERLEAAGWPAYQFWDRIYSPTVFLVGKSDDLNFLQYRDLARQIYGHDFANLAVDTFADSTRLNDFMRQAQLLAGPQIEYPGQPAGFRFMGQRFIPDSWILDELVFDKIPDRLMPTGLDVMAVLGSARALELLKQTPDWQNPDYVAKLNILRRTFDVYPDAIWAQNAYWNWLYCLMPLLSIKGEGYPGFMQSAAWIDKDLLAALASWAELRHDTILYGKQSGTDWSARDPLILQQGYVEPNPHFYARLAALANFLQTGLDRRNLLFPAFATTLDKLATLLLDLKRISELELTNQTLTADDYLLIHDIGRTIQGIVEFSQNSWEITSPFSGSTDNMPVIADVHTDANSGQVLEVGVGHPYCIYVIANVAGQLKITKGACFSYYEFTWPMGDRLTDEKWLGYLQSEAPPAPPAWTHNLIPAAPTWKNPQPDFFYWHRTGMAMVSVTVTPPRPRVGETLTFEVQSSHLLNQLPVITIETDVDTFNLMTLVRVGEKRYQGQLMTLQMTPGWIGIHIRGIIESLMPDTLPITYHSRFWLNPTTAVRSTDIHAPDNFTLLPCFPNPLRSQTQIQYQLTRADWIEVTIFNLMGQRVRTWERGWQTVGLHRLVWDGRDQVGNRLPDGLYFYQLQGQTDQRAGSVVLLK